MTELINLSLLDILPHSLRGDDSVVAAAKAIDKELQGITEMVQRLSIFKHSDQWTNDETNELAWQFHVDFYDPSLPLPQRRELVRNAIKWHRQKGTPVAVEELVVTLFGDGKVEEWFEYGGQPHHFRVVTNNPGVTAERAQDFIDAVDSVKRASAKLERVIINQTESMQIMYAAVLHMGEKMTVEMVR
ncbi:phage tail protein I [Paenibacillus agilis]|uniref:Phage tail protein I n=1 Tax=Paenibacillus agilis TaxID=3020863 RepID=A0A559IZK0_9BACL|nr:phage tail protein I [Paenibacillus agilis]TVX93056.1 phage tail protein I [Paenibacillus agilis]